MVSCTELRLSDGCLIRAKRPVAASTVQASPAGEALLAVESSAMFVLIGSMPHTALLAGQIPPDGKASSYRSMFEIGRAGAFAIGAAIPRPAS
jgi:hypothetical protein